MFDESALDDLLLLQRQHRDIERQFLAFNRIVPYDQNGWDIYSPRLGSILYAASPQILGMFDLIAKAFDPSFKGSTFPTYYDMLNRDGMLKIQKLALRDNLAVVRPFDFVKQQPTDTPTWWSSYNDTKHDAPRGVFKGTLVNVINNLGALAILHDIALLAKARSGAVLDDILKQILWKDYEQEFIADKKRLKGSQAMSGTMYSAERENTTHQSRIFYYLTEYRRT